MKNMAIFKKRTSYTILSFLFGFSLGVILLEEVISLKNAELRSKNVTSIEKEEKAISDNSTKEDCVITNDKTGDQASDKTGEKSNKSDTLFIGCNGFF